MSKNYIAVQGKKISAELKDIEVGKLKFWSENPRVNSAIKKQYGSKPPTDKEIESVLRSAEHVKELLQDIRTNGGLIDPILVKGNVVLEGNSRLCAYRILLEKATASKDKRSITRWSKIKAQVIPETTNEETIFAILGTWHIKGKKQWDTFEKVAYLKRMKEQYKYSTEKISEVIGESPTFVVDNIEAHDLMVKNEVYDLKKFSYFIELVKNRGIKQHAKKDKTVQGRVINAIKNEQFNKAEEIRDVPKILADKSAKQSFLEEGANVADALEIAKTRNPEFDDSFYRHLKTTTRKLNKLTIKKALNIKEEIHKNTQKKEIIRKFGKEVSSFIKKIGVK